MSQPKAPLLCEGPSVGARDREDARRVRQMLESAVEQAGADPPSAPGGQDRDAHLTRATRLLVADEGASPAHDLAVLLRDPRAAPGLGRQHLLAVAEAGLGLDELGDDLGDDPERGRVVGGDGLPNHAAARIDRSRR